MISTDEKKYATISKQLQEILGNTKKTVVAPKKQKDLSFINRLYGFPQGKKEKAKLSVKNEPIENLKPYIPKKELVYETPESLAGKLNSLPNALGIHVIKGFPKNDELVSMVIEAIKKLQGNDRIDLSNIRNGEQLSRIAQRVDMNDMRWHGGGGAAQVMTKQYSLSSQLNGVTTSFTIPANTAVTAVLGSSAPFVFDYTTDYTVTGTTLTFSASVDAPSALASGQTLIVQYY